MNYTRRKFIATMGAGSALLTVPSLASFAETVSPDKKLGIALVGLGNYASILGRALQETSTCYLAGIVTGTPEKAVRWKAQYNIPDANVYNYETFDRIADNPSIDVVYVVLPNSMHREYTIRAARAGKHVFCEKPMAISVQECGEMIDACAKANVRLFIGYRLHSEPYNRAAMKFRTTGVGALHEIESEFGFPIGDPTQWRLKKALAGGGSLVDVGIYAIQAARYSTGEEPLAVTAHERTSDPVKFNEVDDTMQWELEFPGGVRAVSQSSYSHGFNRLKILAEKGWFELDPAFSYRHLRGRTNNGPLDLPDINQQAAQMDDFTRCIHTGSPSDADGEEGKKDLKVIEAIYRSVAEGKKVTI